MRIPGVKLVEEFKQVLEKINGKSILYILRNLIRFMLPELLNSVNAIWAFKMFQLVIKCETDDHP